jgi:hypothetical protein
LIFRTDSRQQPRPPPLARSRAYQRRGHSRVSEGSKRQAAVEGCHGIALILAQAGCRQRYQCHRRGRPLQEPHQDASRTDPHAVRRLLAAFALAAEPPWLPPCERRRLLAVGQALRDHSPRQTNSTSSRIVALRVLNDPRRGEGHVSNPCCGQTRHATRMPHRSTITS